ncbi:hypothetical protein KA005_62685 [bacterium]|nr:hypothetical protein [bacterium]
MHDKVSFLFNKSELELLESVVYLEPFLDDVVENAKFEGDKWIVQFHISDERDVLSALSSSAGWTKSYSKKEEYLKLCNKIKEGFVRNKYLRRKIIEQQIRKELGE